MSKLVVLFFCVLSVLTPVSFAQEAIDNTVASVVDNTTTTNEKTTQVDSDISKKSEIENAQNENSSNENAPSVIEKTPEVGKHVNSSMDVGSMIMSLLMVLALIIVSGFVLKRFNLTQQNSNRLSIVANLSLGAKERVVVLQIGEEQLVLGVSAQQVSLLKTLDKPLDIQTGKTVALSSGVLSFLQKNAAKT
ncbi:flagellar biosynthetic protein FliO [Colwellia sp. 20A7]|uniref:flagellar biosynthetic protein FliO n=1 Tax=Colwellia sp. 20A7 TaxID=2689569 RepID=UPI0013577219|nr:flagellar biosynthetic protein FliO [Colwellia sp. 20A7]